MFKRLVITISVFFNSLFFNSLFFNSLLLASSSQASNADVNWDGHPHEINGYRFGEFQYYTHTHHYPSMAKVGFNQGAPWAQKCAKAAFERLAKLLTDRSDQLGLLGKGPSEFQILTIEQPDAPESIPSSSRASVKTVAQDPKLWHWNPEGKPTTGSIRVLVQATRTACVLPTDDEVLHFASEKLATLRSDQRGREPASVH